jgi:hypothetical protein
MDIYCIYMSLRERNIRAVFLVAGGYGEGIWLGEDKLIDFDGIFLELDR